MSSFAFAWCSSPLPTDRSCPASFPFITHILVELTICGQWIWKWESGMKCASIMVCRIKHPLSTCLFCSGKNVILLLLFKICETQQSYIYQSLCWYLVFLASCPPCTCLASIWSSPSVETRFVTYVNMDIHLIPPSRPFCRSYLGPSKGVDSPLFNYISLSEV